MRLLSRVFKPVSFLNNRIFVNGLVGLFWHCDGEYKYLQMASNNVQFLLPEP